MFVLIYTSLYHLVHKGWDRVSVRTSFHKLNTKNSKSYSYNVHLYLKHFPSIVMQIEF